jgi:hypothetical protein
MTEKNPGQGKIRITLVDMGAAFVLGGLGFAVIGGLMYYFLSSQETEDKQTKNETVKELLETHQPEVSCF